jgi:hypothetical protein
MKGVNLRSLLPHVAALAIFLIITVAYFHPVVMGGKQIIQSDVTNFKGMSKEIVDHRKAFNEEPLWTNRMFGGMPAFQISVLYPSNYIKYVHDIFTFGLPRPVYAITIAMLCFYLLMCVLKVDPWLGVLGGLAYGLGSFIFTVIEAGHNPQAVAIAFLPAVFAGFVHIYRNKQIWMGGALLGISLALELYTNHLQMTYYLFLLLVFYIIAEFAYTIPGNRKRWFGYAVLAMFLLFLLGVFSDNTKMYVYMSGLLALYLLAEGVIGLLQKNEATWQFLKGSVVALVAVALAIGSNLGNIICTADYGKYTTRGPSELTINPDGSPNTSEKTGGLDRSYVTAWSLAVDEPLTLLIPNYKGGSSSEPIGKYPDAVDAVQNENYKESIAQSPCYFGGQPFTSGPNYVGAAMVFLFVLGLFMVDGPLKWALLAGTIISIMLSWGHHYMRPTDFFLDHVPGYDKFRSVSFTLVMASLCIPMLGTLAVNRLITMPDFLRQNFGKTSVSNKRIFFIVFGVTAGFCLITYLAPSMFNSFFGDDELAYFEKAVQDPKQADGVAVYMEELQSAREQVVKGDAGRSFLFIALFATGLLLYSNKVLNKYIVAASMIVLLCIDMILVDRRYVNSESFERKKKVSENPFAESGRPGKADLMIFEDKTPNFRVFNLAKDLDKDAATSYFHNSLGGYHGAKLKRYQELVNFHLGRSVDIYKRMLQSQPSDTTLKVVMARQGVVNMLNARYIIYNYDAPPLQNPYALGHAWFVGSYRFVANPDSEIIELANINPGAVAIVDQRYKSMLPASLKYDSAGSIKLVSYKANHLVYQSKAASDQLAVFSEIYYPSGWNAYVDGKLVPHFGVDYVLRAMMVPAGEHKVEFKFEPSYYYNSEKIAMASSLILIFACIGVLGLQLRKPAAA